MITLRNVMGEYDGSVDEVIAYFIGWKFCFGEI